MVTAAPTLMENRPAAPVLPPRPPAAAEPGPAAPASAPVKTAPASAGIEIDDGMIQSAKAEPLQLKTPASASAAPAPRPSPASSAPGKPPGGVPLKDPPQPAGAAAPGRQAAPGERPMTMSSPDFEKTLPLIYPEEDKK